MWWSLQVHPWAPPPSRFEHAANIATILGAVAVVAAPFGPRAGPGRALVLALRSRLALRPAPQSQRAADVQTLLRKLSAISARRCVVVTGPEGVGKSCAIDTALQRTPGVVVVRVAPGAREEDTFASALAAIAGIQHNGYLSPLPSARRVLWCYRTLLRLPPPVVVLRVSERPAGSNCSQVFGAVRSLAELGVCAVIDGSPNSLEPEAIASPRGDVLEIGPMSKEAIASTPEFAALFRVLRREGLEEVVWAVLGGVPAHYAALDDALREATSAEDAPGVVSRFVRGKLRKAIDRLRKANLHESMDPILALFRTSDSVPASRLKGVMPLPAPSKVLREVHTDDEATAVVPADAAMALVLRHGFEAPPAVAELRRLCALPPAARATLGV